MSIRFSFGNMTSDQRVGADPPKSDTPFRIAVLGDFSGRGARGLIGTSEEIGRRRARKVDRGNLDDLIVKSAPAIEVKTETEAGTVALAFRELDDFHPDAIHGRISAFGDCFDREDKTALMNAIVHDPAFQTLESAWRGVDWLLQGIAKCGPVEVRLIDLSAEEMRADLASADQLEETGLYQILVDQPASKGELDPWTVIVGLALFEPNAADAAILGRIARIARQASAPFLAGVGSKILDLSFTLNDDDAEAWDALRQLPESSMLGLVAPRFLLRAPYGEATRTIDAFEYEEYPGPNGWSGYLWGNSALACAVLMARSFAKDGWAFQPGAILDLGGMVMHVTRDEDDEPVSVIAETRLIRPSAEKLAGLGLMPLLCVKGRDAAEMARIGSLALPKKGEKSVPLLGRWGQKGTVNLPKSGPGTGSVASFGTLPNAANPYAKPSTTPYDSVGDSTATTPSADFAPYAPPPIPPPRAADEPARASNEEPPASTPADDTMDPELAALMAEIDGTSTTSAAADDDDDAPAEEEMDPELAALMAELEGGSTPEPEPEPDSEPEPEEAMDPELAALMAELDGGSTSEPDSEAEPESEPAEEMDPEIAALMAELEGGSGSKGDSDDEDD